MMMNSLIIGNILCFTGSVIMTLIGLIKKKKRFLATQCVMNLFFAGGNLFLGGISGAIANLITMTRNIVCLKWKMDTPMKILFIVLQIVITLLLDRGGWLMWLPVVGVCVFTWFMDTENMALIKGTVIFSQILWGIYDLAIKNYATVPFDAAAAVTNTIALVAILKAGRAEKTETEE